MFINVHRENLGDVPAMVTRGYYSGYVLTRRIGGPRWGSVALLELSLQSVMNQSYPVPSWLGTLKKNIGYIRIVSMSSKDAVSLVSMIWRSQINAVLGASGPRWDISFLPTYVLFWPGAGPSPGGPGSKGWHRWMGKGANPYDAWPPQSLLCI